VQCIFFLRKTELGTTILLDVIAFLIKECVERPLCEFGRRVIRSIQTVYFFLLCIFHFFLMPLCCVITVSTLRFQDKITNFAATNTRISFSELQLGTLQVLISLMSVMNRL